jgi:hypothetical protein
MEKGSIGNPIHVIAANTYEPMKFKAFVMSTIFTIIPVAVVVLMQHPALRQRIVMKTAHYGKEVNQSIADFFQTAANKCATEYNKARL